MMNRITRLQEMAAKAEQELQDFEACFDEQDGDHIFKVHVEKSHHVRV